MCEAPLLLPVAPGGLGVHRGGEFVLLNAYRGWTERQGPCKNHAQQVPPLASYLGLVRL